MTSLEQHLKASRCIHYYWMSFFSVALYFGSCDAKGWVIIQYCIIARCTLSGTVIMQTDVVIIPTDPNFNYRWWNLAAGLVHSNAPRGFLSDVLITWHLSESDTVLEKTLTMKIYHIDIDTAALPPVQCVLYALNANCMEYWGGVSSDKLWCQPELRWVELGVHLHRNTQILVEKYLSNSLSFADWRKQGRKYSCQVFSCGASAHRLILHLEK